MKKILIIISIVSVIGGLLIGSPLAEAGETKGVRYWKNNDAARESYIETATASSGVFGTSSQLRYYLSLKGKKSMFEKAKRQLGALLLNMAVGFNGSNLLLQNEVTIINSMNGNTVGEVPFYISGETSLADAVPEIEHAIYCSPDNLDFDTECSSNIPSTNEDMEATIDLADDLNNRGVYY